MDNRSIGVFDSGVGGLTVVKEIKKRLPNESIAYLGDTARIPYGTRSPETISKFAVEDTRFLLAKDVKCIVVACNTVSAIALKEVESVSGVPVLDVVSAGVDGVLQSRATSVGVLGTRGTVSSHAYRDLINGKDLNVKVVEKACPLFVPLVEEGELKGEIVHAVIEKYLKDLKNTGLEMLILGCTHYPLLRGEISKYFSGEMEILDSGRELARILEEEITRGSIERSNDQAGICEYSVTDLTEGFVKSANAFLSEDITDDIRLVEL